MMIEISSDGRMTGAENMRRDLLLVDRVRNGLADVALRLYQWQPWCVSLGINQQHGNIDANACSVRSIGIVTRPTGGRAVLHANELTYAIAVKIPHGGTAMDVYRGCHRILHGALVAIAPELVCTTVAPSLRDHYASSGPLGQICFSAHAPSELLWNNRKVVGSAQRVIDGVVLQHGSILCGPGHEDLGYLLRADRATQERVVATTRRVSATLSEAAARTVSADVVAEVLLERLQAEVLSGLVPAGR